jgi:hypothetical protein
LPALEWGKGSPIRVLWAQRLEKPVITAQTACECDDIAVLAIYSQLVRKPHSRRHRIATLSPDSDVPLEIRLHIRSLYEKHKSVILDRHQTPEGLLQATTALFAEIWKLAHALNLDGIRGARKALRWYDPDKQSIRPLCNLILGVLMRIVFYKPRGLLSI